MAWQKKYLTADEKSADAKKAINRAVWYLSQRDHGAEELYQKLCRFFTERAAAEAVAKMVEDAYLDDVRYARTKANSLLLSHKSRREIARQLSLKGLDCNLVAQTLDEIYQPEAQQPLYGEAIDQDAWQDPELAAAVVLIERRYQRKLEAGRKDLVVAALTRRGFAYGTIRDALAQVAVAE